VITAVVTIVSVVEGPAPNRGRLWAGVAAAGASSVPVQPVPARDGFPPRNRVRDCAGNRPSARCTARGRRLLRLRPGIVSIPHHPGSLPVPRLFPGLSGRYLAAASKLSRCCIRCPLGGTRSATRATHSASDQISALTARFSQLIKLITGSALAPAGPPPALVPCVPDRDRLLPGIPARGSARARPSSSRTARSRRGPRPSHSVLSHRSCRSRSGLASVTAIG